MPRDGLTTSMITLLFCKDTSSKTSKKKPKCWQRTRVSFPFSQVKQHFIGRIKVDFERGSLPFSCPVLVSIHNSVCRHGVCVRTCKEQRESFPRLLFSFSRLLQKGNESPYIAMSIDPFRTTWRPRASSSCPWQPIYTTRSPTKHVKPLFRRRPLMQQLVHTWRDGILFVVGTTFSWKPSLT